MRLTVSSVVQDLTVDPDGTDTATTGIWVREDPNGTAFQLEDDHTPDPGVIAWVTGNLPAAGPSDDDVDAGCSTLQSPVWDLSGAGGVPGARSGPREAAPARRSRRWAPR